MGLLNLFKKEPQQVDILGKSLHCLICQHDQFHRREAQLNSAVSSFFSLDWTDPTALCVVCAQCGHIHWFVGP
jgi:hypothetical protein